MNILVVHQYYLARGAPGGSRFNEFARLWTEAGHQVTVIAGTLDYITGKVPAEYRSVWLRKEDDNGVTVLRCRVSNLYAKGYFGRALSFGGFTAAATAAIALAPKPDVIIATSPPLLTVVPAFAAAKRARCPWVFEIRDLWPESAVATKVLREDSLVTKGLYALERWACAKSDRINVLTPAFRDSLVARGLASAEKIAFIPNGADVEHFVPRPAEDLRRRLGWSGRFVVLYAGAHGRANALSQLIDAAELLRERRDILIATVGDGPERAQLETEARRRGLSNIVFCGARRKDEMPEIINASDVGAAVLQDTPTFRTVYPNKVFDYMACERPVLLAIDGVARRLVCDDARAGVFATPENPRELADAILRLERERETSAEMGRSGRRWVLANASRDVLAGRYLELLEEVRREGRR